MTIELTFPNVVITRCEHCDEWIGNLPPSAQASHYMEQHGYHKAREWQAEPIEGDDGTVLIIDHVVLENDNPPPRRQARRMM